MSHSCKVENTQNILLSQSWVSDLAFSPLKQDEDHLNFDEVRSLQWGLPLGPVMQSFSVTIHVAPGAGRLSIVDSVKPVECPLSSANGRPQQDWGEKSQVPCSIIYSPPCRICLGCLGLSEGSVPAPMLSSQGSLSTGPSHQDSVTALFPHPFRHR